MNYWEHALLAAKKFGGKPHDYLAVHRFIDSGKLFRLHVKHRLLLHNTYGAELAINLFGDYLENSDGEIVLVREIVHAHCREDLGGRVPSLLEWLDGVELNGFNRDAMAPIACAELHDFLWLPFRRTGLDAALAVTFSDFGVYLVEQLFGPSQAEHFAAELVAHFGALPSIGCLLDAFTFDKSWQYSPREEEQQWLKNRTTLTS